MKTDIGATRKALTAGCFALALVSRVEANDYSEGSWHNNTPLVFSHQVYVLPTSGTLGEGLETRYAISDSLKLRLRQASQNMSDSGIRRSVNYNLTFKVFSNATVFDWHVFGGDFRTSAGMIFGQAELSGTAYYADSVTANGQTITGSDVTLATGILDPAQSYTAGPWTVTGAQLQQYAATLDPAQTATSSTTTIAGSNLLQASVVARYPGHAPYLGLGWGNYQFRKSGFLYTIDIGVMYLGRPKVELSASGPVADYARQNYPTEFQSYLAGEQRKIEETLNKYRYYPVLSVGVWYRF